jgi:PAS domain S-box-containing protein
MALHTAIAFVLAAVGLLCARPDVGAAKTLLGQAQGSVVLRRLLVPILLVPFALGWLRLVGQRAGWYGTAFGVSLTTVSTMFILALLLGLTARALNRAATDRRRAEQERDHFFSLALDLFCIAGEDGFFKTVNPAFSQTLGWSEQELLARPFLDFVHPADVAATLREVERLSAGEPVIHFENRYRCKDGSWRWLAWRAAPGTGSLIYASARDVTDQRRARDELEARVEERTAELARANADLAQHREQLEDLVQERTAELRRIEWLLAKGTAPFATTEESQPMTVQPYGDLTELNRTRLILDAVGQDVLADIVGDYLDLLETSAAVYEQKGEYACGLATSGWCRFMDAASRRLCGTANNQEALICGKWLCHESCWTKASKVTVATGQPVDVECDGGIRLYAVPIRAGVAIVGSINFGYGDPPREPDKQRELAAKYSVNLDELRAQAETYQTRPPYFIDLAKRRLHASARLIGAIVERKQTEQALQEAHDMIRCRAAELGEFNQAMVGREQRIIELKEEVNALCRELERAPSYPPVWRVDG